MTDKNYHVDNIIFNVCKCFQIGPVSYFVTWLLRVNSNRSGIRIMVPNRHNHKDKRFALPSVGQVVCTEISWVNHLNFTDSPNCFLIWSLLNSTLCIGFNLYHYDMILCVCFYPLLSVANPSLQMWQEGFVESLSVFLSFCMYGAGEKRSWDRQRKGGKFMTRMK